MNGNGATVEDGALIGTYMSCPQTFGGNCPKDVHLAHDACVEHEIVQVT